MAGILRYLKNCRGGTLIGILIALAIIGILMHPKTSPFKNVYFDYLAENSLKGVHDACKHFWASEINNSGGSGSAAGMDFESAMSADIFTARAKGGTTSLSECTLEIVSDRPFNFKKRSDIELTIIDGTHEAFQATARHTLGDTTHTINSSGNLS